MKYFPCPHTLYPSRFAAQFPHMWVIWILVKHIIPGQGDRCHRSGSRDTNVCQQQVTEAGTVSDRKTDTENSSEPRQETYKVEFLGNEQLDFPLGIYTAGKKGRTGIIWRWHYKRGNKLNTGLGHGKATGIGMGEQQLGHAWLYIPTGLKWKQGKA